MFADWTHCERLQSCWQSIFIFEHDYNTNGMKCFLWTRLSQTKLFLTKLSYHFFTYELLRLFPLILPETQSIFNFWTKNFSDCIFSLFLVENRRPSWRAQRSPDNSLRLNSPHQNARVRVATRANKVSPSQVRLRSADHRPHTITRRVGFGCKRDSG